MGKSKDKIRISFIGNNATSVAGSMTLITWGKPQRSILVEAGLVQGEKSLLGEYQANNANLRLKILTMCLCQTIMETIVYYFP